MQFLYFILAGILGGILAGMGMGGGTILIPALTIILGVEQHVAQATNLIAFLPMALFSLKAHKERGLLKTEGILSVIIPAVITSTAGGFLAGYLPAVVLRKLFGAFLIFLAVKGLFSVKLKADEKSAKNN